MGHAWAGSLARTSVIALVAALAGCAGSPNSAGTGGGPVRSAARSSAAQVQRIAYVPPSSDAPLPLSLDTSQTAWEIEQQVAANVARIDGASLGPSRVGEVMTILYSGDPRDYVDCGKINLQPMSGAGVKSHLAAEDKLQLLRTSRKPDGRLERKLNQDSRTTVRFSALPGGSTRVDARTRYVVTKEVNSFAFGGGKDGKDKWLGATRESIAFSSGERGSFSVGTICMATGKLEQAILSGVGSAPAGS